MKRHDLILNYDNTPGEARNPTPLAERPSHTIGCPIVKVQIAQACVPAGTHPLPRCLIYSEDRETVVYEGESTWAIVHMLDGRPKAYFYTARRLKNPGYALLALEAPWQDW